MYIVHTHRRMKNMCKEKELKSPYIPKCMLYIHKLDKQEMVMCAQAP